jgi:hypothetical protein
VDKRPDAEAPEDFLSMVQGTKRFAGITDTEKKELAGLMARARHQGDLIPGAPFAINADIELSRENIEAYVRHLSDERRESFFDEASLFS